MHEEEMLDVRGSGGVLPRESLFVQEGANTMEKKEAEVSEIDDSDEKGGEACKDWTLLTLFRGWVPCSGSSQRKPGLRFL